VNCIRYADGYKYQLRAAYASVFPELADQDRQSIVTDWIELDPDGTMRIFAGYAWDGASGPTYDSKSSMRPSLGHDASYQLIRMGLLDPKWREAADRAFRRQCGEDGKWSIRAQLWYQAVRLFAKPATDPASQSPDQCAPEACNGHVEPAQPIEAP
jgi:hypothetical protein